MGGGVLGLKRRDMVGKWQGRLEKEDFEEQVLVCTIGHKFGALPAENMEQNPVASVP